MNRHSPEILKVEPKTVGLESYGTRELSKLWFRLWLRIIRHITHKIRQNRLWFVVFLISILLLFSLLCFAIFRHSPKTTPISPIPISITERVNFPVYYPANLPSDFKLDIGSSSATGQAVVLVVTNSTGIRVVFSEQLKPSDDEIHAFYRAHLPLHTETTTPVGLATIGIVNNKTLASIPTNSLTWLLVTAPNNINQDIFKHILLGIQKQ